MRAGKRTAHGKVQRIGVGVQHRDAEQHEERAADGVIEILYRAGDGLAGQLMEHQRHGAQAGQLVEYIHGHEVRAQRRAQQYAFGDKQEGQEPRLMRAVLHILGGKNQGHKPRTGGQHREQSGHAVQSQGNGQRLGNAPDVGGIVAAVYCGRNHQRRLCRLQGNQYDPSGFARAAFPHCGQNADQNGQQNDSDQHW